MTTQAHDLDGSCHCGNISFTYHSPVPPAEISVRTCDCSFCNKQGAFYASHPDAALDIVIKDPTRVRKYSYATLTSEAWICAKCGVLTFFTSEIEGRLRGIINVNALNDFHFNKLTVPSLSLSNDPAETRLARRKKAWIGQVSINHSAP